MRRGRGQRPFHRQPRPESNDDANPYREGSDGGGSGGADSGAPGGEESGESTPRMTQESTPGGDAPQGGDAVPAPIEDRVDSGNAGSGNPQYQNQNNNSGNSGNSNSNNNNGRRNRRHRGRGPRREQQQNVPSAPVVPDQEITGWFDSARDGGFVRRPTSGYLAETGDAFVPSHVVRQFAIRRGDELEATAGRDQRGRITVVDVKSINGGDPVLATRRPDFSSLTASYPERKLTLETGRPAKAGPELTRRAIDLIAPIGYGQRALIVAPARAGKTMLLQAITEGVAINHPEAALLILLVDERPEEVSEAISWGVGEVIASSFDQPAERHVDITEIVLERARRLVESGKDVVIVLDSLTRMARAHNTAERGTGRTLSGGLDATAMAKPKAFFGSARSVAPKDGGGSLTIIATALVETGSRMDDVIFEEFKGTGNCEIKLDRSLAEKRIFPAFDIATSGTRREEKLYKPEQLDAVYTLRRGLQQMPPQSAMEWLIKRIASTPNNDALLTGL